MDDQDKSVYEPPRATKAAASKPKHNSTGNPSSHPNKILEKNRKTRDRESGAKVLNQLINRLARSHLDDKPTKSQLKKMRKLAKKSRRMLRLPSYRASSSKSSPNSNAKR
jgi:hypothetical protein